MIIEETIYSILGPVFAGELYPVVHPDPEGTQGDVAKLYAIYFKVGGVSFDKLTGDGTISRVRMQVSIYGIDFGEVVRYENLTCAAMTAANTIASQAVDARIDQLTAPGALPCMSVAVPTHGYEHFTKRFVSTVEFYCWVRLD